VLIGIYSELNVTETDLQDAKVLADQMSLMEVKRVSRSISARKSDQGSHGRVADS